MTFIKQSVFHMIKIFKLLRHHNDKKLTNCLILDNKVMIMFVLFCEILIVSFLRIIFDVLSVADCVYSYAEFSPTSQFITTEITFLKL